jgi:hypothetical protein
MNRDKNVKMDLREICCEDGRWMELAQDRVQWQALVLVVLNLRVLLPVKKAIVKLFLYSTNYRPRNSYLLLMHHAMKTYRIVEL